MREEEYLKSGSGFMCLLSELMSGESPPAHGLLKRLLLHEHGYVAVKNKKKKST
jgi:hypothetical protein